MQPKSTFKTLASCLALAMHAQVACAATKAQYVQDATTAIKTLNEEWYNQTSGLWGNDWWQSATTLTTLAEFAILQPGASRSLGIPQIIQSVYQNAPKTNPGFINEKYNDEGWWALALIRSYDATGNEAYLEAAEDIFRDIETGGGTPCKGGIFSTRDRKQVKALSNELYLAVAASLAARIPSAPDYASTARDQWEWFRKSGLINGNNLVNDGLDGQCKNNNGETWTVNQGVILGALVELSKASLLSINAQAEARVLARAAIKVLSKANGILGESNHCDTKAGHCGPTIAPYKGVLIRNLSYLNTILADADIRSFILKNADSVWGKNRDPRNRMGVAWDGPVAGVSAASHASALDALVAAVRVS